MKPRLGILALPLVVTDACCCRPMDLDMALGVSMRQDLTMALGDLAG